MAPGVNASEMQGMTAARPKSVDTAFLLWLAAMAAGVIGAILSFITIKQLVDKIDNQYGVSTPSASPGYGSTIFSLVIFALIIACIFTMRSGANWARIVLTVLGVLSVLGALGSIAIGVSPFSIGGLGIVQGLLQIVQVLLIIAAMVFMFRPDANQYFASRRYG